MRQALNFILPLAFTQANQNRCATALLQESVWYSVMTRDAFAFMDADLFSEIEKLVEVL